MKSLHIYLIITVLFLATTASGAVHSVDDIPNVHLVDSTRFVSNPDGILSATAVSRLDGIVRDIRHRTTAEGVIVVVDDIESDPDEFATDLFEAWAPGKGDRDNGFLVLVSTARRSATIRTGYGLEGVLPDVVCGRIIRRDMAPHFREGDYDGGLIAATEAIAEVLGTPEAIAEITSGERDADRAVAERDADRPFRIYMYFCIGLAVAMLILLLYRLTTLRGKDLHEKYVSLAPMRPVYLAMSFLGMGFPLIAALPLVVLLQHWRNKPRKCNHCGTAMQKVDEINDNNYLSPGQDLEEQLGSVDYDVWLCPKCGETDIEPYVSRTSAYKACPRCGVRAYALTRDRIITPATTRSKGLGVREYTCRACGYRHDDHYDIPRREDNSALAGAAAGAILGSALGGSRGGGFGTGGGFGGGGFGGGLTGGGGATGSW